MLRLIAPPSKRLVWYLSLEEYIGSHVEEPTLITWIVPPTVIFGRHQIIENEVNIDFCQANHIAFYRRKSGGGCVYADEGNLMLSYITPNTHSEQVFQSYLDTIAAALTDIGFSAAKTQHNDILVSDHKVSGNACYALRSGTIVHGTMLYDVDFSRLQQAITPSKDKLQKHGVESVRQRVINLRSLTSSVDIPSTQALADLLATHLCSHSRTLTEEEMAAVDAIEQTYLDTNFIFGKQMKQVLASPLAPKAVGPYCQAVNLNGTVFMSGQLPVNPQLGKMPEGIEEQTRQSLLNIENILRESDMRLTDIVKTTVLLSDIKNFSAMNAVYAEIFEAAAREAGVEPSFPARVCYEVAALPMGAMVEIDCIAGK